MAVTRRTRMTSEWAGAVKGGLQVNVTLTLIILHLKLTESHHWSKLHGLHGLHGLHWLTTVLNCILHTSQWRQTSQCRNGNKNLISRLYSYRIGSN